MNIKKINNNIVVTDIKNFDLAKTLECGQCFRWNRNGDGSYTGVAFGKALTVAQNENELCLFETSPEDFENIWIKYFDLQRDYDAVMDAFENDPVMANARKYGYGIRLLSQEVWETVISFIISASNNIPRIKKIIELLCGQFGNKFEYMGKTYHSFPSPEMLKSVSLEDLGIIRSGFRDKYILDAVKRANSGELPLDKLTDMSDENAKKALMSVSGIGNKVADCIMLFGLSRYSSFPVDVWIKRIIEHFYFDDKQSVKDVRAFAEKKFGSLGGFAQQYLFYYARENKIN